MTNAEKFKTASERKDAYQRFVRKNGMLMGEFFWLELEAEEELLPCPFCGGYSVRTYKSDNHDVWYVSCNECGVRTEGDTSEGAAIAAWNRRAK